MTQPKESCKIEVLMASANGNEWHNWALLEIRGLSLLQRVFLPPGFKWPLLQSTEQERLAQSRRQRHHYTTHNSMKAYYTIFPPPLYTALPSRLWPLLHVQSNNHLHWTGRNLYRLWLYADENRCISYALGLKSIFYYHFVNCHCDDIKIVREIDL